MVNKLKIGQRVANDPKEISQAFTFLVFISQRTMQVMVIHAIQILKLSLILLIILKKITAVTLFGQWNFASS